MSAMVSKTFKFVAMLVVGAVLAGAAAAQGWLSPFGVDVERRDSQVITAVERTQEVSLLRLQVQGIAEEKNSSKVFGRRIPGTGEKVYITYNFAAKLGFDGSEVTVDEIGSDSFSVSIPEFKFIGYDEPEFEEALTSNGPLSGFTPDIDKLEVVNKVLNEDARNQYLDQNRALLKEQAQAFYDGLIKAVAPQAEVTYEFRSEES